MMKSDVKLAPQPGKEPDQLELQETELGVEDWLMTRNFHGQEVRPWEADPKLPRNAHVDTTLPNGDDLPLDGLFEYASRKLKQEERKVPPARVSFLRRIMRLGQIEQHLGERRTALALQDKGAKQKSGIRKPGIKINGELSRSKVDMNKLRKAYQELEDIDMRRDGKNPVNLQRRPSSAPFERKNSGRGGGRGNGDSGKPESSSATIGIDDVPLPVTRIQIRRSSRTLSMGSNKSVTSNLSSAAVSADTTSFGEHDGEFSGASLADTLMESSMSRGIRDKRVEISSDEGPMPLRMDLQSRLTRLFSQLKMEARSQLAIVVK